MSKTIYGRFLNVLLVGAIGLILPLSAVHAANAGCCSKHGGVSSCDAASGYLMCKDKTRSPSCACNNKTATKQKTTTANTTTKQAKTSTTNQTKKDTQTKTGKTKKTKTTQPKTAAPSNTDATNTTNN